MATKIRETRDIRDQGNPDAKIYVGDITFNANRQDLEDAFSYYGPVRSSWVARNPPGFAFVEFEDPRDAEDAVKDAEGSRQYCRRLVCGRRVRIELSNRSRNSRSYGKRGASRGQPDSRCFDCGQKGHVSRNCRNAGDERRSNSRSRLMRSSPYTARSSLYTRGGRRSPSYTRGGRRSPSYTRGGRRSPSYTRGGRRSPSNSSKSRSNSPINKKPTLSSSGSSSPVKRKRRSPRGRNGRI